ncbi:MAG: flagellar biosynthesis protein FlhF [Proteobacteria bacterium]|jgi:flagellar biosynthesis protein FlhF|nr:flagellar biosynthesis protein FlhF [Pseudomonadota bacterium]
MKVKRYFAANMRSALDMIKQDQGPDVLILSNRKVDGGVELITADELTEQEAARLAGQQAPKRRPDAAPALAASTTEIAAAPAKPAAARRAPAAAPLAGLDAQELLWTDASVVGQMREELNNLKGLLESQLSGLAWSEFGSRHPLRARLMRVLGQLGICPALARQVVENVPDELDYRAGWHRALALLVMRIATRDDPIMRHGGRVALLGPTGVGKSTAVSKLAARYALKFGAEKVGIVSMDDRRIGAHQQMKAFGRLIGVAVHVARDASELGHALVELKGRSLVLIDTPGAAPQDSRYQELARSLRDLNADIDCYTVLSSTTDYLTATKLLKVNAELAPAGCILTKLDEAATLGPCLSAIIECALPIAYTSAGQRVPDDLDTVTARSLIERTVEMAKASPAPRDTGSFERAFSA